MNMKALITTLFVLGSSSVALARPVIVSGNAGAGAPIVRDHRAPAPSPAFEPAYGGSYHSGPFVPVWTTLGAESRIVDGEMSFRVSPYLGRFSTLRLQSSSGKALIYKVKIQVAGGRTQVVELNRYLNASNPTITIDLAGDLARSIKKVTVVGRNARRSAYSVLAN